MTTESLFLARIAATVEAQLQARQWKRTAFAHGKLHPNTVRNVLNGKDHRLSTLIALAEALECDLEINILPRTQADLQHIERET